MNGNLKTSQVSHVLNVPYHRLINLIRYSLIPPPPKDYSGDYLWGDGDVDAARVALAQRDKCTNNIQNDIGQQRLPGKTNDVTILFVSPQTRLNSSTENVA
jgi:hypothetical protein